MSDHLPIYVWGRAARGALILAGKGWGLGATMHADSLQEAIEALRGELGATDPDLAGLTIYLQYSAYETPAGMYRRIEEAWHLRLDDDGVLAPVRLGAIAVTDRRPHRAAPPPMLPRTGVAAVPARPVGVRDPRRQPGMAAERGGASAPFLRHWRNAARPPSSLEPSLVPGSARPRTGHERRNDSAQHSDRPHGRSLGASAVALDDPWQSAIPPHGRAVELDSPSYR